MDLFAWIAEEFQPRQVTSDEMLYEHMESQSGRSLAVIYQPFDSAKRAHWDDRGRILDFLEGAGDGHVLDIGPGDGWPSLPLAPFVRRVTAVDASALRLQVCSENAQRLGVTNFEGVHVPAGSPLPFPDGSFDGVTAATSLEQTPDPAAMVREVYRVLRPGGRLRMSYEALGAYRRARQREVWAWEGPDGKAKLVFYDRRPDEERALQYGLHLRVPLAELEGLLGLEAGSLDPSAFTPEVLQRLRPQVLGAQQTELRHPGAATWMRWLREAGFRTVRTTHGGGAFAARLYDETPVGERPGDMAGLDRLLRPLVRLITDLDAPPDFNQPILAVK